MTTCHIHSSRGDRDDLVHWIKARLPSGSFRRICIKPNWVIHEENPTFPIEALITSPMLLDACIAACLDAYPEAERIDVGDVPLQSCEFENMICQSGTDRIVAAYSNCTHPKITFTDWRRERYVRHDGYLEMDTRGGHGDPDGYREILIDRRSFLEPISSQRATFRVSDYDPGITTSSHQQGHHRYIIAGSALNADLFINLPKMKTHQKAGITGALKNLVGINGQKGCLVHHRRGHDEFGPDTPSLIKMQVRIRELLQKKSRHLFKTGRAAWKGLKKIYGIQTEVHREALASGGHFYTAAGSWYGNDSIWRMVYDLNQIIRFAPAGGGQLKDTPQRTYLAIVDGIIAGEGNGPLQPLSLETGRVWASDDPFAADMVMARLMGFDALKIPSLSHHREFPGADWGQFDPDALEIINDDKHVTGLSSLSPIKKFIPAPGWKGHIEDDRFNP